MRSPGNNNTITINSISVSYNDNGPDEAPVIIFIHGFPFNKSMWDSQVEVLKNDFRIIAYDVRGHGDSEEGNMDFTIELFVQDLQSLMDELKLDKVLLCGLSMGGYIALNAIEKYPERFEALVLSDTQCIADTPEAKEKRMKAIESIKENGVEKYAELSVKNLFSPGSFTAKTAEIAAVKKMIVNTSIQSLCKTLVALSIRKETCTRLNKIAVPVLIMVGKEDMITPLAAARFMHENIKGSDFQIIDHAGHLANMENSIVFNKHLKNFLQSKAKNAGAMSY